MGPPPPRDRCQVQIWPSDWLSSSNHVKMAVVATPQLLLLLLVLLLGRSSASDPDSERGRVELRRVRSLARQPRYGACWARAVAHLDARCRDLTSESQSRIALAFTMCHLSR